VGAGQKLSFGPHLQGEQWIKILLPAQRFQADPVHLAQKHLELSRWPSGTQLVQLVGCDHHHLQMLDPRVLLQKPVRLRCQAVVEARIWVHLHLQQHHGELRAARFGAAGALPGPEHTIEVVAQLFELWCFKPIEAIAGILRIQTPAECATTSIRQQCADQVGGALKNAVVSAVGVQTVLSAG